MARSWAFLSRGFSRRLAAVGTAVVLIALAKPIYVYGVVFGIWQPLRRPPGCEPRLALRLVD